MILRVIIIAILLMLVMRSLRILMGGVRVGVAGPSRQRQDAPPVKLVRDPVCGTHVAPRSALTLTSGGTTHYFCSEECRAKFGRS